MNTLTLAAACAVITTSACPAWSQAASRTGLAPVDGGQVEYVVSGPEDGEQVLLIHGSGLAASFAPIEAEPALARYRLIRPHRRGYAGSSEIQGASFAMADQAADLLALMDALGVSQAHLVGHSYGGAVALEMAKQAPARVRSLVIIEAAAPLVAQAEPPPTQQSEGASPPLAASQSPYAEGNVEGAIAMLFTVIFGEDWRAFFDAVPGGYAQAVADAPTLFEFELPALFAWDYDSDDARAITQPMLYMWGEANPVFQVPPASGFEGLVADLALVEIADTDHALITQKPDELAAAIAEFVARHPM